MNYKKVKFGWKIQVIPFWPQRHHVPAPAGRWSDPRGAQWSGSIGCGWGDPVWQEPLPHRDLAWWSGQGDTWGQGMLSTFSGLTWNIMEGFKICILCGELHWTQTGKSETNWYICPNSNITWLKFSSWQYPWPARGWWRRSPRWSQWSSGPLDQG